MPNAHNLGLYSMKHNLISSTTNKYVFELSQKEKINYVFAIHYDSCPPLDKVVNIYFKNINKQAPKTKMAPQSIFGNL